MNDRSKWLLRVTLGEALGFVVPACVGVAVSVLDVGPVCRATALVLAGAVEGAILGAAQASALPLPIRRERFIAWTSIGAASVWAFAMTIVTLQHLGAPSGVAMALLAIGAPFALVGMGLAQWLELRHHVSRAWRWILWTALAWMLALPVSFAPSPIVDEHTPWTLQVPLWLLAGLGMAFVLALVSWQGVRQLRDTPAAS